MLYVTFNPQTRGLPPPPSFPIARQAAPPGAKMRRLAGGVRVRETTMRWSWRGAERLLARAGRGTTSEAPRGAAALRALSQHSSAGPVLHALVCVAVDFRQTQDVFKT